MKLWIGRNGRAVLISVLMIVLISITITRPAWQDNIGYLQPKQTVRYGHSTIIGGVRWQLTSIKPPDKRELQRYAIGPGELDDYPPNSQLVTYVLQRDKDGKPAALPPGFMGCTPTAVAGKRQWWKLAVPLSVQFWSEHLGYTTICSHDGPLLVALFVPTDVHIDSIDVQFLPTSWDSQQRQELSKPTDLLVIGFDTS